MKKVLLCGANGFVGSAISTELTGKGFEVLPVSRSSGIDLTAPGAFEKLGKIPNFDFVVFAAGKSGVMESWENPELFYQDNILSILSVLRLLRIRLKPMVYISSYMYGSPRYLPIDEKHPISCNNPYAYSKLQAEEICSSYFRLFRIPMVILRPFNLYGKGMGNENLIGHILAQLTQGPVVHVRDLSPRRDYVHINDFARSVSSILNKEIASYSVYNIGSGFSRSVQEILAEIELTLGTRLEIHNSNEKRPNEIPDCFADITAIQRDYGWETTISLQNGIKDLLGENNGRNRNF